MDSLPLRRLVAFEDSLFDNLTGQQVLKRKTAHPVILIDIDDRSLLKAEGRSTFGETPPTLVARLIERIVQARASALYIDLDLRSAGPGGVTEVMDAIATSRSLRRSRTTRVLVPTFLSGGLPSSCHPSPDGEEPGELPSPFDAALANHTATAVHSIVMTGPYAFVEGTCSSYTVRRASDDRSVRIEAAMPAAFDTGREDPAKLIPMRLFAGLEDRELRDGNDLIFAHLSAVELTRPVGERPADLTSFKNAVVIIGSSHRGSADEHPTPDGNIPGALVQANIGIGLNTDVKGDMPLLMQAALDVILALFSGGVLFLAYRLVTTEGKRRLLDFGVTILVGVLAFMTCVWLQAQSAGLLASWRFGLLTCVSSAVVLFAIGLLGLLAEFTAEAAVRLLERLHVV